MTKEEILKENGIEFSEYRIAYIYVAQGNVESAMDSYATAQTAELQKEVERLKGLVEKAYYKGFSDPVDRLKQFKTDNNL